MIKWLRRKSLRNKIDYLLSHERLVQTKAFVDISNQIFSACESGNLVLAKELSSKMDLLPCPTCRRNQPLEGERHIANLYEEYLALGGNPKMYRG